MLGAGRLASSRWRQKYEHSRILCPAQREDALYVGDSRVTLHTLVANWRRGAAPEEIQAAFPSLPLVAIYGAITYYLEHQTELDAHCRQTEHALTILQAGVETKRPGFFAKMRARIAARSDQHEEWRDTLVRLPL